MNSKWKSVLIGPELALEEAIVVLDKGGLRIAVVVDVHGVLLGTLTDGDVRRALLRHVPMQEPVAAIMCVTPQVAQANWSREHSLGVMARFGVLQLPIVDAARRVIGIETLEELVESAPMHNPVFLMAGGFGTRLHPLTHDCPKPLLNVGDKPILELILQGFIDAGFHRFFISTHFLPGMIRDHFGDGSRWGVTIRYVHEETPLGTGGALGLLPREEIDLPLIMMNGDLLTRVNYRSLLDFHRLQGGVATMCGREYEHQVPYGVVKLDGHRITSIVEKPVHNFFINAGIYVLSPEFVRRVAPGSRIDMPALLEQTMAGGEPVSMFPLHEYWLDIGRLEDFKRAQVEFEDLL
ncbi:nucleotidyltransferase family protein [Massilia glaciei]|uniref:CBS domain-containing protein n=1 Tax=Massilia glaciei TaxID=1524097 RepID=A0A2U2HN81_9BURK|nr:nucleotidyltransferase family protein [Massilia glaciei]PWF48929.1 CBS domain-containing protein [Massilia glaciei]